MAEHTKGTIGAIHNVPQQPAGNTLTLRIPKPNIQVVVLGLVAFITLFQTFQLFRINGAAGSASVKSAPAAASTTSSGAGSGSNASTPQSMVGGC